MEGIWKSFITLIVGLLICPGIPWAVWALFFLTLDLLDFCRYPKELWQVYWDINHINLNSNRMKHSEVSKLSQRSNQRMRKTAEEVAYDPRFIAIRCSLGLSSGSLESIIKNRNISGEILD